METERYDLVFRGELVAGADPAQVKQNLQQLFRIDAAQVEKLFAGKPVLLKKNLDSEAANKYRVALKKAGARLDVVASEPAAVSAPPPPVKAPAPAERVAPAAAKNVVNRESGIHAPDFGIAAAGADLLRPEEKPKVQPVQVDVSRLKVAPMAGNLVAEHERAARPTTPVIVPQFDVLPPGSDVLTESERELTEAVEVDTSGLSVAAPGTRLGEPAPAQPAPPNVDHIHLQR